MLPDATLPDPADRGYEDDPMQVERGATPDGRPLLYFTFRKPDEEPRAPREDDGAAGTTTPTLPPDAEA